MHPAIVALLDLHKVNVQRQRLVKDRGSRNERRAKADAALAKFKAAHARALAAVEEQGAPIRQYTADVERCNATIEELRTKQMEAKTNKDYLAVINGIENAKAEKNLRQESLATLGGKVDELQGAADAAKTKLDEIQGKYDKLIQDLSGTEEADTSFDELERIYNDKRTTVDPKFLEVYERLIDAGHSMPLVPIDPATRATPLGQVVSHNDCEQVRLGGLVQDQMTNGILYLNETAQPGEGDDD